MRRYSLSVATYNLQYAKVNRIYYSHSFSCYNTYSCGKVVKIKYF